MKQIVIVGGGITGLSTAYYLEKFLAEHQLTARIYLIEANDILGGKLHTIESEGFMMEAGADSIVARKPNVASLMKELNLEDEMVYNSTGNSFLYIDHELKPIPEDSHFGIPLMMESLVKSELISAEGKVEALKDFYTPNESFTKNDSIGKFLSKFLGKEIVDRQIGPVLSGVYSGNIYDLTIASTLPHLLDYKNEYGSILKGLHENRKKFQSADGKKFISFQEGTQAIVRKLENLLTNVEVLTGVRAEQIERAGNRYNVTLSDQQVLGADDIVMSTPHAVTQSIMKSELLDESFSQMKNSSLISVYLGFDISDDYLPQDGTGFIVADESDLQCNACTWTSRKWKHTSESGKLLVRLFYKSSKTDFERLQQLSDEDLLDVALLDVQKSLNINEKPVTYSINKWIEAMPTYHIQHNEIIQALEERMAKHYPHIHLAGCSYYGVGIPDCIANGEKTAKRIVEQWKTS